MCTESAAKLTVCKGCGVGQWDPGPALQGYILQGQFFNLYKVYVRPILSMVFALGYGHDVQPYGRAYKDRLGGV